MLIYHWTTIQQATKAIKENNLKKRNWKHFIDSENALVSGTSWGIDPYKWKCDHSVCFIIDSNDVDNAHHFINGNRVYLKTQGMIDNDFDPNAWKFESEEVDECFIIGNIKNFKSIIKDVIYNGKVNDTIINFIDEIAIYQ